MELGGLDHGGLLPKGDLEVMLPHTHLPQGAGVLGPEDVGRRAPLLLEQQRRMVRGSLSHLVIEPSPLPHLDGTPLPDSVTPLLDAVRADERVKSVSPQLSWFALLIQGGRSSAISASRLSDTQSAKLVGVQVVGIDIQAELATTELRAAFKPPADDASGSLSWGRIPLDNPDDPFAQPSGTSTNEPWAWCVVGQQLAVVHGLTRGSEINLDIAGGDPEVFILDGDISPEAIHSARIVAKLLA